MYFLCRNALLQDRERQQKIHFHKNLPFGVIPFRWIALGTPGTCKGDPSPLPGKHKARALLQIHMNRRDTQLIIVRPRRGSNAQPLDSKSITLSIELRGRTTRIILENEILIAFQNKGALALRSGWQSANGYKVVDRVECRVSS